MSSTTPRSSPTARHEVANVSAAAETNPALRNTDSGIPTEQDANVTITCFIRYELDPFKRPFFKQYAEAWAEIIPRCGGHLLGYFMPHEGTNYEAWGLVALPSLAAYETYRVRLKSDARAQQNFEFAQREMFIRKEERRFTEVVDLTFQRPALSVSELHKTQAV